MDALAFESHFLDHMAPVWRLLTPQHRGRLLVDPSLMDRAARLGLAAFPQPRPPHTDPQPKPNTGYRPAFVASYGDIKEARRLGYGPFAYLEHGAGQTYKGTDNGAYAGGKDHDDNELFLVPNEHAAAKWRAGYPNARVAIVGCPKLDDLPTKALDRDNPTIALTWHWPASLSISGYAGTALNDYRSVLPALAAAYPGRVIGHCHPNGGPNGWPKHMKQVYQRARIPFVADFEEVCRVADLLIFDNTSAGFEFAATGRPVVVLNARVWSRRYDAGPPRFWDAAHVGVNVDRREDLLAAVEEALQDHPERQRNREEALQIVYQPRTNGAAYAATAINDWLASTQAEAA